MAASPSASKSDAICVIVNPGSGRRAGELSLDEMEERLTALPRRVTIRHAGSGSDITRLAQQALDEGYGTIVAAGGDGTICAVASVIIGKPVTFGVIPMGTFNFFARGLGIPEEVEGAVRNLATGTPTPVTVGEVNGALFLNNASLGAYPAILDQREGIYKRWGRSRMAAYYSVLTALINFRHPLRMRIIVDGRELRRKSPLAFVAMSAFQLDIYQLDGADAVRNGEFALYVAPDAGRLGLLKQAVLLAWRRMRPGRDVELVTGKEIIIDTNRKKRLVARDGEKETMSDPFRFTVRSDELHVLAPTKDHSPAS
ncbi:hypothetical protein ATO6_17285 [Oceanicola sp. 22II-s10i]|nr:hypothetical protein ATO6_17285 [Oceanicola sp. 22II-s10i]